VLYAVQKYGTDQTMVQRYLTAKNDKEAKSAAFMGILLSIPVWALFMFIGTALFVFYQISPAKLPAEISADAVFPYFIMTELPIGVTGFVIAGLIAAAISSLDSDTNCLAAIGVEDYYQRFKPDCTDQQRLKAGRVLVAIIGIAAMGVAVLYVIWEGEGVLGIIFGLYAIFSAGIAGIFLLGLLSRRANKQGLYVGISTCILFTAYAVLTSTKIGESSAFLLDLGPYNFPHHKYMIGVYSHLIVFGVGYIASFFFKYEKAPLNLTIYGYFQNRTMTDQEVENGRATNRKTKVTVDENDSFKTAAQNRIRNKCLRGICC
jgi:solute:Na+ symporter, SSS family